MRILQWLLALVFAVTAGLKLGSAPSATMFNSLPPVIQWILLAAELALSLWLASGFLPRWSALATIVVLSTFLGALVVELGKPDPQPCGCLGALSTGSATRGLWISLSLDGVLLLAALWLYFLPDAARTGRAERDGAAEGMKG